MPASRAISRYGWLSLSGSKFMIVSATIRVLGDAVKKHDFVQDGATNDRLVDLVAPIRRRLRLEVALELHVDALRARALTHARRGPGDGVGKRPRPLPDMRIMAPVRRNEVADPAQRLKMRCECGVKGDRRMKEEVAARELNDGHPRGERPRHLRSKEHHVLERPIRDPNAWGKRLVHIDGFIESGDRFDWHSLVYLTLRTQRGGLRTVSL